MTGLLRSDLLDGVSVLLAAAMGPPPSGLREGLGALGARVADFAPELDEAGAGGVEWVKARGQLHALVFDGRDGLSGGQDVAALGDLLDAVWIAVAAAANGAFIPSGDGGRIVLIAPARESHPCATAAAAGLENLARTLSVEWARHEITVSAVTPGATGSPGDLVTLVAFLLSRAGAYFSGSRMDLGRLKR